MDKTLGYSLNERCIGPKTFSNGDADMVCNGGDSNILYVQEGLPIFIYGVAIYRSFLDIQYAVYYGGVFDF